MEYLYEERGTIMEWNGENDLKITRTRIPVTEEDVAPSDNRDVKVNTRQLIWEDNNNMDSNKSSALFMEH